MHAITISEKGSHEFEGEQGWAFGRLSRDNKERRIVAIKLSIKI